MARLAADALVLVHFGFILFVVLGGYLGGQQGAVLFFVIAAVMNFGMYWTSHKVVLRMYRARIVGPEDANRIALMRFNAHCP